MLFLGLLFGIVYAVGFHTADEIISGTFLGNYIFSNNVTFNGVSDFTNATVSGISSSGSSNTNLLLNTYQILDNNNLAYQLIEDGFMDAFNDETGVDTTTSINVTYEPTNDYYNNPGGFSVNVIPAMTTDTIPSGIVTYSSLWSGYTGWQAFDGVLNTGGGGGLEYAGGSTSNEWIAYQFILAKKISKYILYTGTVTSSPIAWTFEGWSGSTWIILDTRSGETGVGTTGTARPYIFSNNVEYIKYRIKMTQNNGHSQIIGFTELTMHESFPSNNITLISNNFIAQSSPTTATITILEEDVNSTILNTDIKAFVSNDGGTNWDQITLSYKGNYSSNIRILTGSSTLTGTGTDMKYNITTHNSKSLKIHGVGMTWS